MNLPTVSIIGRPNVGKSSLFNLLVKKRKSIISDIEGTTRDINIEVVTDTKTPFFLYDTAGYLDEGDRFNRLVQDKIKEAVERADLLILMVDGREYHPIDEEIALFLRQFNKPILVLVNKLDSMQLENLAPEFYALGYQKLLPFSVEQKRHLYDLLDWVEDNIQKLLAVEEFYQEDEISVAIVGKPNVGKSQMVNALLGYSRSIVSETAGTTRDAVDDVFTYNDEKIRLIDTAGLRRKGKIEADIEYYSNVRTIQAIEKAEVTVLLMDAVDGLSHQDKRIAARVIEKKRPLIIAINKWDLVHEKDPKKNYDKMNWYTDKLREELPEFYYVPILFLSGKMSYKLDRLLDKVLEVHKDFHYRIPTNKLNDWVKSEIKETNLDKPTSRLKIYYATQVYTAPPRVVVFINNKDYLRKDYPRFFENKLRLAFEFTGVPVQITFREHREEEKK